MDEEVPATLQICRLRGRNSRLLFNFLKDNLHLDSQDKIFVLKRWIERFTQERAA